MINVPVISGVRRTKGYDADDSTHLIFIVCDLDLDILGTVTFISPIDAMEQRYGEHSVRSRLRGIHHWEAK